MKNKTEREESTVFGRRLRQARKWAGLPQDRLGVAIGLDETTSSARISRYETGVHEPPIATARLLALELPGRHERDRAAKAPAPAGLAHAGVAPAPAIARACAA